MQKKSSLLGVGITIGIVVAIVLVVLLAKNFATNVKNAPQGGIVGLIVLKQNGTDFSLDASGNAIWTKDGQTRSALWSSDKTASFFSYYYDNWASSATVVNGVATVNGNGSDELASAVIDEGGGSGGNGNGSTGGDDTQYFGSPTPTPGGGSGGDNSGGSGGDDGGPSWCKHWRLSYCADPPPDTSTPAPTPTPSNGPTPLPPDCNDPGNQETGRTVIGNNLCLPTPSPTPTP